MQLDNKVMPWKSDSSHLVSLLDMIKIDIGGIAALLKEFEALDDILENSPSTLSGDEIERITKVYETALNYCKLFEFEGALRLIKRLNITIFFIIPFEQKSTDGLKTEFSTLHDMIQDELKDRLLMFIPLKDAEWYEKEKGFGNAVYNAFSSATDDIKEVGNCYATGRYTACVFHAMRVLEHGLRALAKNIGVDCGKKSWGKIIGKIKEVIDNLNPQTKTEIEHSKFLSEAATEFRYFKDAWRNHVSHLRYTCKDREEALLILNHVKSFMAHLSKRLSE